MDPSKINNNAVSFRKGLDKWSLRLLAFLYLILFSTEPNRQRARSKQTITVRQFGLCQNLCNKSMEQLLLLKTIIKQIIISHLFLEFILQFRCCQSWGLCQLWGVRSSFSRARGLWYRRHHRCSLGSHYPWAEKSGSFLVVMEQMWRIKSPNSLYWTMRK